MRWSQAAFLDIGAPGMSGYEVAMALRANPATAHVTLVAITGWGARGRSRKAFAAGFNYHMTKPVEHCRVQDVRMTGYIRRICRSNDLE
jgi:CheY-like chemotaxis protein